MAKVKAQISISADGYMAGPNQSEENPLGEGGEALHEWVVKLRAWREPHGKEGGEENASGPVFEEAIANVGAVVMGRNMFGPVRGDWGDRSWRGWWGEDPPFHTPVYVLTHHPREPLEMEGGTSFHFVTDGLERAIELAREAAADRDVSIGGGAQTLQQCIGAGHLDELLVSQVPVILGGGERLLDEIPPEVELQQLRVVEAPGVAHILYRFEG
jgi:dihydrofolate reductase